ncbi:MAG TPA: calcium-binding protein [Devosia sp.]|jgi:Ca2+-binding RTX toxin-like protein|uniref:calcium-binding protein n=1 Tax=Devosia sp. TaxID=1871048 RepID=UPI002F9253D4
MPTLSNGSELKVLPSDGTMPHSAFYFTLTSPDGSVSDPFGALPDYFFGWVELASVHTFDGFFAITGLTHDGKYELNTAIDTYIFDNAGNHIRTLSDEAAYLSAQIISVEAESPDDVVVTWNGATPYGSGENTQFGEHQIIVSQGNSQPDAFKNDLPEVSDLKIHMTAGQSGYDIGFTASDADYDLSSFEIVGGPAHGTLNLDTEISGNPYPFYQGNYIGSPHYHAGFWNNNQFNYQPDAAFVGSDSFTVRATEGLGYIELATITINVAPPSGRSTYTALTGDADTVRYHDYNDGIMVAAKAGDDNLFGSGFNDSLNGGAGDDLLHGELGRDKLTGGKGVDRMQGGAGNDTFIFAAGDIADPSDHNGRMDHIIDFHAAGNSGSGEQDFLSFFGFSQEATLTFDHNADPSGLLQVYKVDDPLEQSNSGLILVQMADGTSQIEQGDYRFF